MNTLRIPRTCELAKWEQGGGARDLGSGKPQHSMVTVKMSRLIYGVALICFVFACDARNYHKITLRAHLEATGGCTIKGGFCITT